MKPIKIKLIKSVSVTNVNSEQEEAKRTETKPVKVDILQNLSSLKKKAEEENLVFNLPPEIEEEEPTPARPPVDVIRRSRTKSTLTKTSTSKVKSPSTPMNQKKELEKIKQEWEKIEAARKENNDMKEKIETAKKEIDDEKEKIKAARKELNDQKEKIEAVKKELNDEEEKLAEERSKLNEEKMQIDEEWGSLHEMKEKMLRESESQSNRKDKDDITIVVDDDDDVVTFVEEVTPKKSVRSKHDSSGSVEKSSRKRKRSSESVKKSKKGREEARENAKEGPRLRLKDFSLLAKEFSSTEDEIIEIIEEEDSPNDLVGAQERRDLKKFKREVLGFLPELYRRSMLPESFSVPLGEKFYNESVEAYVMNNGTGVGISMTKEIKKSILLQIFILAEIRSIVELQLKNHSKKFTETFSSLSLEFLSLEFLDNIIESKKLFDKKVSKDLTGDHKQWIANQIKYKIAQLGS